MPTTVIGDNTGDDYSGTEDTQIQSANDTAGGDGPSFEVTKYAVGVHISALVRFPGLSNIPSNALFSSTTFSLYLEDAVGVGPHTLTAYRLLQPWVELYACWVSYNNVGGFWGTPGGLSDGVDRIATVSATASVSATPGYFVFSGAQLAIDAQGMCNGTYPNYGWIIERTDGLDDTTYRQFTARTGADGQRPKLTANWATGLNVMVGRVRSSGVLN